MGLEGEVVRAPGIIGREFGKSEARRGLGTIKKHEIGAHAASVEGDLHELEALAKPFVV